MNRSLKLSLNSFPKIPHSLRAKPEVNEPDNGCQCDLARLFHHYYIDTYGRRPPNPDPANFEYVQFLSNCDDFRFTGDGIGVSTSARRNISTALGQAFCRWFLHEHLNITYFAHMNKVVNRSLHRGFGNLKLLRVSDGDVPDYVCAENVHRVYLAEAKGRYTSISFTNREFDTWRRQFTRVEVRSAVTKLAVKGYIIGTRFATEENRPNVKSAVFAEDPRSPGERPLDEETAMPFGSTIIAQHYVSIFQKLDQSLIAAALETGSTIPKELQLQATVWQFQLDNLKGMRFVGGYWPSTDGLLPFAIENDKFVVRPTDPFRLDTGRGTFFGVEESIFHGVAAVARLGTAQAREVPILDNIAPFYSAVSLLRDGSVIGPAEFFLPVGSISI